MKKSKPSLHNNMNNKIKKILSKKVIFHQEKGLQTTMCRFSMTQFI